MATDPALTIIVAILTGGAGVKLIEMLASAARRRMNVRRDELAKDAVAEANFQTMKAVAFECRNIGLKAGIPLEDFPTIPAVSLYQRLERGDDG